MTEEILSQECLIDAMEHLDDVLSSMYILIKYLNEHGNLHKSPACSMLINIITANVVRKLRTSKNVLTKEIEHFDELSSMTYEQKREYLIKVLSKL